MLQSPGPYVATTIELPSGLSEGLLMAPFAMPLRRWSRRKYV
jgi:hypothetical protein